LKTCSECGTGPTIAKGYCWVHYQRLRRFGRLTILPRKVKPPPRIPPTFFQRLFDKMDVTPDCWRWKRPNRQLGYGYVFFEGKHVPAHRIVYTFLVGPIADGLEIDHLCRVRACVNPDHLEPVTHAENIRRSPTAAPAVNARRTHCLRHPAEPLSRTGHGRGCAICYRASYMTPEARAANRIAVARYKAKKAAQRQI